MGRDMSTDERYPPPQKADLVTWWLKDGRTVMTVTAAGKVHDFEVPIQVLEGAASRALETLMKLATRD